MKLTKSGRILSNFSNPTFQKFVIHYSSAKNKKEPQSLVTLPFHYPIHLHSISFSTIIHLILKLFSLLQHPLHKLKHLHIPLLLNIHQSHLRRTLLSLMSLFMQLLILRILLFFLLFLLIKILNQ